LSTSLRITLQNKFLDFLNVEVSARTISSKIVSAWGVRQALMLILNPKRNSDLKSNFAYKSRFRMSVSEPYFQI
jgi:hypothetical protein